MITTTELRARVEELEAVAEHVPPAVLGHRLIALLENHLGDLEADNIWDRFQGLIVEEEPPDEAAEIFDPGIPASAEDRAAPQRPEPSPTEVAVEPAEDSEGEPSKPCKDCGVTKPLSDFPVGKGYKDGRRNKCKSCTREYQQRRTESRERAAEGKISSEVRELRPTRDAVKGERLCASGTSCAAVDPDDLIPTPAILDEANPGPLCRRCQRRAGVA